MEIGGLPMSSMIVSLGGCGSDLVGFFFFFLNLGFWFQWDFGGQWAWWRGRHGGGGVVMIGLFGC